MGRCGAGGYDNAKVWLVNAILPFSIAIHPSWKKDLFGSFFEKFQNFQKPALWRFNLMLWEKCFSPFLQILWAENVHCQFIEVCFLLQSKFKFVLHVPVPFLAQSSPFSFFAGVHHAKCRFTARCFHPSWAHWVCRRLIRGDISWFSLPKGSL